MPTNIEIKAHARHPEEQRRLAEELAVEPATTFSQRDTFFPCEYGRLKLREEPGRAELIFYDRPNSLEPSSCDYRLAPVGDADTLREVLRIALGVRGEVRKSRTLYVVGQTRVHFDEVEGLGSFVELEVVLRPDQEWADGERIARELMEKLHIEENDLIDQAYIDMLAGGSSGPPRRR